MTTKLYAQQAPQFTQYMSSQLWLNPAYAGADDALSISLLYRNQWSNIEGAPVTQALTAHSLFKSQKVGLGLVVLNDKIGIHSSLKANSSFSYRLELKKATFLSFGLHAGINYENSDYNQLSGQVQNPNDPTLNISGISTTNFDVGAGIYLKSPKFNLGLSIPSMLSGNNSEFDLAQNTVFLITSYKLRINSNLKLIPGVLVKYIQELPIDYDLNLAADINEVLLIGLSYRNQKSLNAMCQVKITPQLTFGYAYDHPLFANTYVNSFSNEFMISYLFNFYKREISNTR